MVVRDSEFVKTVNFSSEVVDFSIILYCLTQAVRQSIFEAIQHSGNPSGNSCINQHCFKWQVKHYDKYLRPMSDGHNENAVTFRKLQISSVE